MKIEISGFDYDDDFLVHWLKTYFPGFILSLRFFSKIECGGGEGEKAFKWFI